jgi:hypothetical protein
MKAADGSTVTGHAPTGGQASDQANQRAPGRHRSLRPDRSPPRHPHTGSVHKRVTNKEHRHHPDNHPRRAPNTLTDAQTQSWAGTLAICSAIVCVHPTTTDAAQDGSTGARPPISRVSPPVVRTASSSWAWRFSGGQRKSSSGWAAESSVPSRPFRLAPERTRRPRSPNGPLLTLAACRSFHDEVSPWKHQTGRSKPGERGNTSTTRRPRVGLSLSASRAVRSRATSPSERSALGRDKTDRSAHLRQR